MVILELHQLWFTFNPLVFHPSPLLNQYEQKQKIRWHRKEGVPLLYFLLICDSGDRKDLCRPNSPHHRSHHHLPICSVKCSKVEISSSLPVSHLVLSSLRLSLPLAPLLFHTSASWYGCFTWIGASRSTHPVLPLCRHSESSHSRTLLQHGAPQISLSHRSDGYTHFFISWRFWIRDHLSLAIFAHFDRNRTQCSLHTSSTHDCKEAYRTHWDKQICSLSVLSDSRNHQAIHQPKCKELQAWSWCFPYSSEIWRTKKLRLLELVSGLEEWVGHKWEVEWVGCFKAQNNSSIGWSRKLVFSDYSWGSLDCYSSALYSCSTSGK